MTADELRHHLNTSFGADPLPETLEVDCETYANICYYFFVSKSVTTGHIHQVTISLGKHNGIMYKGVELILSSDLRTTDYK